MSTPEQPQQSDQFMLSPEQQAALSESSELTAEEIRQAIESAQIAKIHACYVQFIDAPTKNNLLGVALKDLGDYSYLYGIDSEDPSAREQLRAVATTAAERFAVIGAAIEQFTPVLQVSSWHTDTHVGGAYKWGRGVTFGVTTHAGFSHVGPRGASLHIAANGLHPSSMQVSGRELHKYTAVNDTEAHALIEAPAIHGEVARSATYIGSSAIIGFLEASRNTYPEDFDGSYLEHEIYGTRSEYESPTDDTITKPIDGLLEELVTRDIIATRTRR